MGGHLFVLRGDLTKLHCSAVLIPCDSEWRVVKKNWAGILPKDSLGDEDKNGWAPFKRRGTGRFTDAVKTKARWVRLVVTADDNSFTVNRNGEYDSPRDTARWVAAGVVEAIADWSSRSRRMPTGRVKPLIGLPLVGTGDGGFLTTRGVLIEALLPQLRRAAREHDVDIALVLKDQRDHAAVQALRTEYWSDFRDEEPRLAARVDEADRLGCEAAKGHLSLFLGSGVSVPLGVPDWKTLLEEACDRKIHDFDPEKAPDIAQKIERDFTRESLNQAIRKSVTVSTVAPAHLLLAALSVRQTVTTNYDTAYERALKTTVGPGNFRVLTAQLARQPEPWVLKLHGCVSDLESIVITSDDYEKLRRDRGALQAIVESLMLTSHIMFVGFSMGDPTFVHAAGKVQDVRKIARQKRPTSVGTVLALDERAVAIHPDFKVVPMLDHEDPREAARLLEIFLDRVAWRATTMGPASSTYLLDPSYRGLFPKAGPTSKLRARLEDLVEEFGPADPIWEESGWRQIAELLSQLGDHRFGHQAHQKGKVPAEAKGPGRSFTRVSRRASRSTPPL
jgi:hypothetical protein